MTFGTIAASAGVLLALSAASAAAAPALAVNNVNLRQGPGTTYTVIMTIPGGSNVDVSGCSGQWCQVTFQGQNGYAIATSFDQGGGAPPPGVAAGPPPDRDSAVSVLQAAVAAGVDHIDTAQYYGPAP